MMCPHRAEDAPFSLALAYDNNIGVLIAAGRHPSSSVAMYRNSMDACLTRTHDPVDTV